MITYYPSIHKLLLIVQFFTALVGFVYFFKLKYSYWKWFSIYVIVIFLLDLVGSHFLQYLNIKKSIFYAYLAVPLQYMFFFWLYALKSLKNKMLFVFCSTIYLSTYLTMELFFKTIDMLYSVNFTIGTILLTFLAVLEFVKQIKNDNILKFKKNKMFYINTGILLFYVGTYPFFAFMGTLKQEPYIFIWNLYYKYFLFSNILMYLLFLASFVWGKHLSK